ncbi:MAG: hypothetical protein ACI93L_000295 [Cyclobacteriaceae bacterium]|jgi:hypothetical protein
MESLISIVPFPPDFQKTRIMNQLDYPNESGIETRGAKGKEEEEFHGHDNQKVLSMLYYALRQFKTII